MLLVCSYLSASPSSFTSSFPSCSVMNTDEYRFDSAYLCKKPYYWIDSDELILSHVVHHGSGLRISVSLFYWRWHFFLYVFIWDKRECVHNNGILNVELNRSRVTHKWIVCFVGCACIYQAIMVNFNCNWSSWSHSRSSLPQRTLNEPRFCYHFIYHRLGHSLQIMFNSIFNIHSVTSAYSLEYRKCRWFTISKDSRHHH